jgi:hypothetical protein
MLAVLAVLAARALQAHLIRQESIIYRRAYEAALGAPLWSTTHNTFIVTNLTTVLGVLLIAVHSLPLHYRPKQSLKPPYPKTPD